MLIKSRIILIGIIMIILIGLIYLGINNNDIKHKSNSSNSDSITDVSEIDKENLDEVISEYIENNVAHRTRGGKSFEAHELYGTEEKDGEIYVYLWTYFMEYYLKGNKLVEGGGGSLPIVIIITKDKDGNYSVKGHKIPGDGAYYTPSIRKLFPQEYHDKIFSRNNVYDLEPIVEKKAKAYFKMLKE